MKIRLPIRKPVSPAKRPPKLKLKASVASRRRAPLVVEEEEDEFLEEPEPNMKLSHAFVVVLVLHVIAVGGVFAFNSIKAHQNDKVFASSTETAAAPASTAETAAPAAKTTEASSAPAATPAPITEPAAPATANLSAPASVPTNNPPTAAPAPAAANGRTHALQPGETLTKVATQYGVTVAALEAANGITDPTKIRAGTDLVIPAAEASTSTTKVASTVPVTPAAAPTTVKDSGEVYTVAKGDNPVKIAKKLKVPYADLMALNGNPDPRKLQIGQKFKIPAKTQP